MVAICGIPHVSAAPAMIAALLTAWFFCAQARAVELPPETPLWDKPPAPNAPKEQVRSHKAEAGSGSGMNRAFSSVSSPTYSIHRPGKPNGVGLVICPGGGFRDVWIDREGHDLAIWLKKHGVTSLVLKYRTRLPDDKSPANAWPNYQRAVLADARQAVRILRRDADALGLQPDKIGICGFSAGGHLALTAALRAEPKPAQGEVRGMPDFAGLFYPGIPDDADRMLAGRTAAGTEAPGVCPMFLINARVDRLTPVDRCLRFYTMLLKAGVNAELHVFSKGAHGFDMGVGRGESVATWPTSFVAWLRDCGLIQD